MRPFAGVVISQVGCFVMAQEIARAAYTQLYAVIGTTYKANPTEGFFAVPDLRGRFPLGADNMGDNAFNVVTDIAPDVVGAKSGSEDVSIPS